MTLPSNSPAETRSIVVRLLAVSTFIVIFDQVTKFLVQKYLALHEMIPVVPGCLNLTHLLNPGGAFGFFAGSSPGIRKFIFLFISSAVALIVLWFYSRCARTHTFLSIGLAMIFAGAVGNLIDRFRFGHVIDFIDFYIKDMHWWAFNVADSAITIGMGILIYHIVFNKLPDI